MANETTTLVREARKAGMTVNKRRGGHLEFVAPNGGTVIAAATPSDSRSIANTRAKLRQHGLNVPDNRRRGDRVAAYQQAGQGMTTAVLEVLQRRPNVVVTSAEIRDSLAETLDGVEPKQVTNALQNLARRTPEVLNIARGAWMFNQANGSNGNGNGKGKVDEPPVHVAMEPSVDEVAFALKDLPSTPRGLKDQARKAPEADIVTVNPELATVWLSANLKNRDLRLTRVVQYAGILGRGEWELLTDCVGFDTAGNLINGQHRLAAIVVTGKSARLGVMWGLQTKSQDVMDRNLKRSIGDSLRLRGETYVNELAGILNWMYRFDYMEQTGQIHYRNSGERPTAPQLLRLLDGHPTVKELPRALQRVRKEVPVRSGVMGALWHRFRAINRKEADLFVDKLTSGAALAEDDPIFVLRRQLIQDKVSHYERMPDYREAALIIKAWNAWREQRPITNLNFKYGPTVKEAFPLPV